MGTLGGFAPPFGPPPAAASPLASPLRGLRDLPFPTTPARYARVLALGLAKPCALAPSGKPSSANANTLIRREEPVSEPCRLSSEVLSKLAELCPMLRPMLCPMLCPEPRGWPWEA
jgi:hypothetical protein